jgi:electron-transferring-flavoprotein dehydrogenase
VHLSFDVIFVGAGPASLAGALLLKKLARANPRLAGISVAVIEKAPNLGDQSLSGATFDVRALEELIPNFRNLAPPLGPKIRHESLSFLTKRHRIPIPLVPPPMSNRGKYLMSLAEFVAWLGKQAEREGVEIYLSEAVEELIEDSRGAVVGVRIKGKGFDREGRPKTNALASTDVGARVVVLGEGARGHVTKQLVQAKGLCDDCTPQGYAMGLKELWEVREDRFQKGTVINTLGYPLSLDTFGGSFIYHVRDRLVAVGLVTGLDYKDPLLHPFERLQRLKAHPFVARQLEGARLVSYGAKAIAEGGYFSMPRPYGDGFIIIGEAAGILDAMKLKGIDLAMKSGMLGAESIYDALAANDTTAAKLSSYQTKLKQSWVGKAMWRARNFHQGFHRGILPGAFHTVMQFLSGGRGLIKRFQVDEDALCLHTLARGAAANDAPLTPDAKTIFDKLTCVFASGTKHEEDQPCHILISDRSICNGRCREEFGNPCQRFCPANVFEMAKGEDGEFRLQLNPANCLHCKTCDIKDPYRIVTWDAPEGGGGPNYKGM